MSKAQQAIAEAAIRQACKQLHTPTIAARARSLADEAVREGHTNLVYLSALLQAELDDRRPASDAASRLTLSERVSDIQKCIDFHRAWLGIESTAVGEGYEALVAAVRKEAGEHMKSAWKESLITTDEAMSLGKPYACPETATARLECMKSCSGILSAGGNRSPVTGSGFAS